MDKRLTAEYWIVACEKLVFLVHNLAVIPIRSSETIEEDSPLVAEDEKSGCDEDEEVMTASMIEPLQRAIEEMLEKLGREIEMARTGATNVGTTVASAEVVTENMRTGNGTAEAVTNMETGNEIAEVVTGNMGTGDGSAESVAENMTNSAGGIH